MTNEEVEKWYTIIKENYLTIINEVENLQYDKNEKAEFMATDNLYLRRNKREPSIKDKL